VGRAAGEGAMDPTLLVEAWPPPRFTRPEAGKVEKTLHSPHFLFAGTHCDHRWSGLGPRESLSHATSESFLPVRRVWSLRNKVSRLKEVLPQSSKILFLRPEAWFAQPPANESRGGFELWAQPAGETCSLDRRSRRTCTFQPAIILPQ
jgi:hypothetical protein